MKNIQKLISCIGLAAIVAILIGVSFILSEIHGFRGIEFIFAFISGILYIKGIELITKQYKNHDRR